MDSPHLTNGVRSAAPCQTHVVSSDKAGQRVRSQVTRVPLREVYEVSPEDDS